MEHFIKRLLFSMGLGIGGIIRNGGEGFAVNLNRFINGYTFKCTKFIPRTGGDIYVFEGAGGGDHMIWLRYTVAGGRILEIEVLERVPE